MGRPERLVDADARGGSWPKGYAETGSARALDVLDDFLRAESIRHDEAAVIGTEPGQPHLRGASHPRARSFATAEISGEVIHQLSRIVLGTVDEARFATAQHGQPEHEHPRAVDDAAVVAQVSFLVQDGHMSQL